MIIYAALVNSNRFFLSLVILKNIKNNNNNKNNNNGNNQKDINRKKPGLNRKNFLKEVTLT